MFGTYPQMTPSDSSNAAIWVYKFLQSCHPPWRPTATDGSGLFKADCCHSRRTSVSQVRSGTRELGIPGIGRSSDRLADVPAGAEKHDCRGVARVVELGFCTRLPERMQVRMRWAWGSTSVGWAPHDTGLTSSTTHFTAARKHPNHS